MCEDVLPENRSDRDLIELVEVSQFCITWHSSFSGTGKPPIKYPRVSNVWPALSLPITVSSFLLLLFSFHGRVSDSTFLSLSTFSFHSLFHFSCMTSLQYEQVLKEECVKFFLPSWCFFVFFLYAILFPGLPACPRIQQSSTVFPNFSRFAIVCFSFRTFWLVGNSFWSACWQLFDSVNIKKLFLFVVDFVCRARWI